MSFTAIILAAGKGSRMKSGTHKVLHPIGGLPMVDHLLATVRTIDALETILVVGDRKEQLTNHIQDAKFAAQTEQLGTGHAVKSALPQVSTDSDSIMVLCGDMPFVKPATLRAMLDKQQAGAAVVMLGFDADDPKKYGRLIVNGDGDLEKIVEFKDASDAEKDVTLCNSGMALIDTNVAAQLIDAIGNDNNSGEFYLTDIVAIARDTGLTVGTVVCDEEEAQGINSRADLAEAEYYFQTMKRTEALDNGATLLDPETTYFAYDTVIGKDVVIEPNVFFGMGVRLCDNVTIKANSHLEGAVVGSGAVIGPFARLRPGTVLGTNTKIGNFVETKKAEIEDGAKVNHLSYVGDARVGPKANIGAGTITCNYDGFFKYKTDIGAGSFIGSNTALVAPVTIGDGATVGAGSTVTKDVESDALAVVRAEQKSIKGWAKKFRDRMTKKKAGL